MQPLILAGLTLLTIIVISFFAMKKGQSGFGVFFLLYSVISVIVHIATLPEGTPFEIVNVLGQIGVIVTAIGVIYAHAKGLRKVLYALPGLLILGVAIFINIGKVPPPSDNAAVNGTNQTVIIEKQQADQ